MRLIKPLKLTFSGERRGSCCFFFLIWKPWSRGFWMVPNYFVSSTSFSFLARHQKTLKIIQNLRKRDASFLQKKFSEDLLWNPFFREWGYLMRDGCSCAGKDSRGSVIRPFSESKCWFCWFLRETRRRLELTCISLPFLSHAVRASFNFDVTIKMHHSDRFWKDKKCKLL